MSSAASRQKNRLYDKAGRGAWTIRRTGANDGTQSNAISEKSIKAVLYFTVRGTTSY